MKYACLVYHGEGDLDIPDDELRDRMRGCGAWVADLERGGHPVVCAALQSAGTATTLRSRNGKISATDGPFAETKEVLAGFALSIWMAALPLMGEIRRPRSAWLPSFVSARRLEPGTIPDDGPTRP